jgi:hypothetical protein
LGVGAVAMVWAVVMMLSSWAGLLQSLWLLTGSCSALALVRGCGTTGAQFFSHAGDALRLGDVTSRFLHSSFSSASSHCNFVSSCSVPRSAARLLMVLLDAAFGWALVLAQFGSLVLVPSLLWVSVSPWAVVRRSSSQGEGAGVPLRPWKRMDKRRLALLVQPQVLPSKADDPTPRFPFPAPWCRSRWKGSSGSS